MTGQGLRRRRIVGMFQDIVGPRWYLGKGGRVFELQFEDM